MDKHNSESSESSEVKDLDSLMSILHDIANPLTVLQINLELLKEELNQNNGNLQPIVAKALSSLGRAKRMIINARNDQFHSGNLVSFSAVEQLDMILNMNKEVFCLNNVAVERDYEDDKMFIADLDVFQRIITNLIVNAVEALSGVVNRQKIIRVRTQRSPKLFVITVSDNGEGIPASIIKKIFIQGFSTKSGGAGLGLAITRHLLQTSFNGTIKVSSFPRKITSFKLLFPLLEQPVD